MRQSISVILLVFTLSAVTSLALLTGGCGGKGVALGPKPNVKAWQQPHQDNMRSWLSTLNAQDAKTLKETGQVEYQYATLKTSDPTHAAMVEKYVEAWRIDGQQRFKAKVAKPMPWQLVESVRKMSEFFSTPHDPDTVGFYTQGSPGAFKFEMKFNAAEMISDLLLSEASGAAGQK